MQNNKKFVLKFGTAHCGPCRQLKPIFTAISEEYKDQFIFREYDCEEDPMTANKYNIMAVPTIVVLDTDEATVIDTIYGAVSKSELKKRLDALKDNKGV